MDNPDPRSAANRIIAILRKITRIVQLAPFVYLLVMAVCLMSEPLLPEWALRIADSTLNMPIYAMAGMLGLGRMLKLCQWFRAACLMPMATKVESWVDAFLFTFTQNELVAINVCLGIIFLAYIYLANRHFFHGFKAAA